MWNLGSVSENGTLRSKCLTMLAHASHPTYPCYQFQGFIPLLQFTIYNNTAMYPHELYVMMGFYPQHSLFPIPM